MLFSSLPWPLIWKLAVRICASPSHPFTMSPSLLPAMQPHHPLPEPFFPLCSSPHMHSIPLHVLCCLRMSPTHFILPKGFPWTLNTIVPLPMALGIWSELPDSYSSLLPQSLLTWSSLFRLLSPSARPLPSYAHTLPFSTQCRMGLSSSSLVNLIAAPERPPLCTLLVQYFLCASSFGD